jgi:hypothetical protein
MEINVEKLAMFLSSVRDENIEELTRVLPFWHHQLDLCFKYLGYILKTIIYIKEYMSWLLERIECLIGIWCHKWFSKGGKLILINSVMEDI